MPQLPGTDLTVSDPCLGLRLLQADRIDLYHAHYDDATTPLEESLTAFDELVQAGKVRYVAASNYWAARLTEAQETARRLAWAGTPHSSSTTT